MITQTYQTSSSKLSTFVVSQSFKKAQERLLFTPNTTSYSSLYVNDNPQNDKKTIEIVPEKECECPNELSILTQQSTIDSIHNQHKISIETSRLSRMLSDPGKKDETKRRISNDNKAILTKHKKRVELKLNNNNDSELSNQEKILRKPKKGVTSFHHLLDEKEIISLSNMEEISNFYEYTSQCFQLMRKLTKIQNVNKCTPLHFPFDQIVSSKKRRLAIFDLDETLVHCQAKSIEKMQNIIEVTLPSRKKGKIGVNVRPNWESALSQIKEKYIIVVYTASHQTYADAVLDFMDPANIYFQYRLYRNNCTSIKHEGKEIYIKDLSIFKGINLKDIVIIDNSVVSFAYHLDNGLPILPYYDSSNDCELMLLAAYLNNIYEYDDLREANRRFVKIDEYKSNAEKEESDDEENNNDDVCFKAENYVSRSSKV